MDNELLTYPLTPEECYKMALDDFYEAERRARELDKKVLEQVRQMVSEKKYNAILECIEDSDNTYSYSFETKSYGDKQKDYGITYYVNQTTNGGYSGDSFGGTVSIPVGQGKYFQFYYSM